MRRAFEGLVTKRVRLATRVSPALHALHDRSMMPVMTTVLTADDAAVGILPLASASLSDDGGCKSA
jgi:hypothetical protein